MLHVHLLRGSRPTAILLVACLIVGLPTVAASAADDDPEAELDRTRERIDEVAAELDVLRLSDHQLEARLVALDAEIAAAAELVATRDAAADAAAARLVEIEEQVAAAASRVVRQEELVERRAVSAYIDAGTSQLSGLFESEDYNEYSKRVSLLGQVAEHDQDLLGDLLEAKDELSGRRREADDARADADRARDEAQDALGELEAARAEQRAVQDALGDRIASFQNEAAELASQEDALLDVIAERASQPDVPVPPPTVVTTVPPTAPGSTVPGSTTSAPATTTPTTTTGTVPPGAPAFQWPIGGVVTSPFGWRWGQMHNGIDIAGNTGDPIAAAAGGTVILASWFGGYGNCVMIDHGGGYVTVYGHQSAINVSEGQTVSAGSTVGLVGSTGHSTGPHLHFEVRVGGVPQDPMLYLP